MSFPTKLGVPIHLVILLRSPELKKMHLGQIQGQNSNKLAINAYECPISMCCTVHAGTSILQVMQNTCGCGCSCRHQYSASYAEYLWLCLFMQAPVLCKLCRIPVVVLVHAGASIVQVMQNTCGCACSCRHLTHGFVE